MTRSDIVLEMARLNQMTGEEKTLLIMKLEHKIEEAYALLFALQDHLPYLEDAPAVKLTSQTFIAFLRKALESE
jgi:hypothetical protein